MTKRIFNFKAKAGRAMAVVAAALTLGVTSVTGEFNVAPDSVEFERASTQSEQLLTASGLMDAASYGRCSGWACQAATCGKYCWCAKPDEHTPGVCQG